MAAAIGAAAVSAAGAQQVGAQQVGVLKGAVLKGAVLNDTDEKPIRGAQVAIDALGLTTLSDSTGTFRLIGVPAGQHIVWVRKIGFSPVSAVLTFARGDTLENEFMLMPAVTKLPEVAVKAPAPVTGKLSEFEERRKKGFGHFLTETDLAKMENRRMAEIMQTLPGLQVVHGTTSAAWMATQRGAQSFKASAPSEMDLRRGAKRGLCYAAVILDGIFVYQGNGGEALWDINSLHPAEIAGVEVYSGPASIPAKYNGPRNACGLVVIWSK